MSQPVGRELRSVVNALFLFALFLLVYSALVPGHSRRSARGPRFLRMQVEDLRNDRHRVSFAVPYSFVSGALRFASLGKVRREMDLHFDQSVDAAEIRTIVQELKDKPEGTDVMRTHEDAEIHVKKEGDQVVRGERIGMIKFGSRVDMFLPATAVVKVSMRDKVKVGLTVVAELGAK